MNPFWRTRSTRQHWDETEDLLSATRPQPVALPVDAAQSLFVRALAESGVQPDGRSRSGRRYWLAWTVGLTCLGGVALFRLQHPPSQAAKCPVVIKSPLPVFETLQRSEWADAWIDPLFDTEMQPVLPTRAAAEQQTERMGLRRRHHPMRRVAAPHHRLRHRHGLIAPYQPPTPMLPQHDDEPMVAQVTLEPQAPQGRLLVVVTQEPTLPIEVTHESDDTPGYAAATCFRHDIDRADVWHRCTVSKDDRGTETVQTQVALATPGPQPGILLVQAATSTADQPTEATGTTEHETAEPKTAEREQEEPRTTEPETEAPKIAEPGTDEPEPDE